MKLLDNFKKKWLTDTPPTWSKIRNWAGVLSLVLTAAIAGVSGAGLLSYLPNSLIQGASLGIFIMGGITAYAGTRVTNKPLKDDVTTVATKE